MYPSLENGACMKFTIFIFEQMLILCPLLLQCDMASNCIRENAVLASELELLDSMFSSTPATFETTILDDKGQSCLTIASKKPRFIFHIHLKAGSE